MKVIFDKDTLLEAVTPALGTVSDRNTLSATEGILLSCDGKDNVIICAYDLEKGMKTSVAAKVLNEGSYIINANKLSRIIRTFPAGELCVEVNDRCVAKISSGRSQFELHVLPGSDFPNLPELSGDRSFTIPKSELKSIISQISHAIAQNDLRPALNGAYFVIKGDMLTAVACDNNRIAVRERRCGLSNKSRSGDELDLSFIVPGKTLAEVMKLIGDGEDEITVTFGRRHIIFFTGNICFFSRLIDSDYIDYKRYFTGEHKFTAMVEREPMVSALERASLVTEERTLGQAKSPVKLEFSGNSLNITSTSVTGSFADEIFIDKEGVDLLIGFNCRYLLDALRAASGDKVKISGSTSLMNIVIEPAEPEEDSKFLYLVLPVKL